MKIVGNILKVVGGIVVVLVVLGLVLGGSDKSNNASSDSGSDKGQVAVESQEGNADTQESSEAQSAQEDSSKEKAPAKETKEKYTITDETYDTSSPYTASIKGVLTNNTDRDVSYIQVEYILYDADGNQIGSAFDNLNNLKAGGTWKFEAIVLSSPDEVASYELAGVTGF